MLNSANHRLIKANLTRSSLLLMLLMHNATMEELQQQSGMAESTETFESQQPLTPLLACICSFRAALPAKSFSDSWLIFQHTGMREIRDRKRAVLSYARPWVQSQIRKLMLCVELFSLFQEATIPKAMNSGIF